MAVSPITAGRFLVERFASWSTAINLMLDPPGGQFRQSGAAQPIPNTTFTALTFSTEEYDNRGGHSTSVNTSRYTCQAAGRYQLSGKASFAMNATGARMTQWRVNGAGVPGSQLWQPAISGQETMIPALTTSVLLAVGDYVELFVYQTSGGSLNTSSTDDPSRSYMHVRWVGEA